MNTSNYILLRRTLVLAGSVALSAASVPAFSATATLGSASCQHNGLTVDPAGNITVNCNNSTPTAAQFSLSGPSTMTVGATGSAQVSRSGGPAETLAVNYAITGTACTNAAGSLSFVSGAAPQNIPLTAGAAAGTCTVSITAPTGHSASPSLLNITVAVGGGGEPVPPGCPTPQADYKLVQLGWSSAPSELRMGNGVIASFPIPGPKPGSTKASVRLSQGQTPVSPGGNSEFYISKCPGVIDTTAGSCYKSVTAGNYTSAPDAYTKVVYGWDTQAELDRRLSCWAPAAEGQWYVNVRWNYTTNNCPYGCGYSMQWFEGSY